jgi:hypothetical protein
MYISCLGLSTSFMLLSSTNELYYNGLLAVCFITERPIGLFLKVVACPLMAKCVVIGRELYIEAWEAKRDLSRPSWFLANTWILSIPSKALERSLCVDYLVSTSCAAVEALSLVRAEPVFIPVLDRSTLKHLEPRRLFSKSRASFIFKKFLLYYVETPRELFRLAVRFWAVSGLV